MLTSAVRYRDREGAAEHASRNCFKSDLNLIGEVLCLEEFCIGKTLTVDEWIEEIGGGLNFKRPKFVRLFDRIIAGEIKQLVIAHKDRLARFGFDFLKHLCGVHRCDLIVMNTESLSPEREMVEDLPRDYAMFFGSIVWPS